ncbi:hypothetical protein LTR53_016761 [Teratosphaeriaceae sp. CCFEE 6253]|nr:hypothetical protein LTR53_016761 [Teratosphaeriaceae sp. CCFEE 6253]
MATATRQHYGTIVIGAGMSGLACASRLFQHEHYKQKGRLLVLEARDRIGGRIGSVRVNGSRLDTGANWIHGIGTEERPNPLMEVLPHKRYRELGGRVAFRHPGTDGDDNPAAQENDWVHVEHPSSSSPPSESLRHSDKDLVIPGEVAAILTESLWGMIGSLHEFAESTSAEEAKRTTMLEAITRSEVLQDTYNRIPKEYHQTVSGTPQFIENMEAGPLTAQSAEQPQGQAGMGLLEFALDDFEGDQVFLQDGYIAVIGEVAKQLINAGIVNLNEEVKQIRWDASLIEIDTTGGTYTADEVICSLPLGVLQYHQRLTDVKTSLFLPELPDKKREAIASLGFGTLDKIFLVYDSPWWTEEPFLSILRKGTVPSSDDEGSEVDTSLDSFSGFTSALPGLAIHQDGTVSPGLRNLSVINLHALTGFPALSCFVSCANAVQVEAMSNVEAGDMLQRALTSWCGREVPGAAAVHVTRWAQDQHSRGSYSHMIAGLSEVRHRAEFQEPVGGGRLRFAGEHTSRNHFATVHGALLSGWREADAILDARTSRA